MYINTVSEKTIEFITLACIEFLKDICNYFLINSFIVFLLYHTIYRSKKYLINNSFPIYPRKRLLFIHFSSFIFIATLTERYIVNGPFDSHISSFRAHDRYEKGNEFISSGLVTTTKNGGSKIILLQEKSIIIKQKRRKTYRIQYKLHRNLINNDILINIHNKPWKEENSHPSIIES